MGRGDPLITFRRVPEHAGIPREELEAFAQVLRKRVARSRHFHCRITGDSELRRLNRDFLGKNYPTDVLSFPSGTDLSGDADAGQTLGDLAISRHRAAVQARRFGHSLLDELELLMLHGVLHLTGLDHEIDNGEMAGTERRWRVRLGLPMGLTERASA